MICAGCRNVIAVMNGRWAGAHWQGRPLCVPCLVGMLANHDEKVREQAAEIERLQAWAQDRTRELEGLQRELNVFARGANESAATITRLQAELDELHGQAKRQTDDGAVCGWCQNAPSIMVTRSYGALCGPCAGVAIENLSIGNDPAMNRLRRELEIAKREASRPRPMDAKLRQLEGLAGNLVGELRKLRGVDTAR